VLKKPWKRMRASIGHHDDADRDARIRTFAEALDRSKLGHEAGAWLKLRVELAEAQLRKLKQGEPPPSWKQRVSGVLTRSGPIALSAGTALVVLAMVVLAVGAVAKAALERAVIVEALSVPQSLAERGVTGQVAASELLDRMLFMQHSGILVSHGKMEVVPPGTPVKVEISTATITLDEVFVYLRNWLGHDTFVSGELIDLSEPSSKPATNIAQRNAAKYELVARVGTSACTAAGSNLDFIYNDVAGCVLWSVDPFHYATFLAHQSGGKVMPCSALPQYPGVVAKTNICRAVTIFGTIVENEGGTNDRGSFFVRAAAILEKVVGQNPSTDDAPNSLATIGHLIQQGRFVCTPHKACTRPDLKDALGYEEQALQLSPDNILALGTKLEIESNLGYAENALSDNVHLVNLYESGAASDIDPIVASRYQAAYEAGLDELRYDYGSALPKRKWLVDHAPPAELLQRRADYNEDVANEYIVIPVASTDARAPQTISMPDCLPQGNSDLTPIGAEQAADCFLQAGDYADALSTIAPTPADCYDCVLERNVIRRAQARAVNNDREWHRELIAQAVWWSEKARVLAPDLPGGWFDTGKNRMEAGDWRGAVAAFAAAHDRAPHNADILEYWGVALLEGLHDPDQAIRKFVEAANYAPRWGQLRMKWGEALAATRAYDDAWAKYREAGGLALAKSEQAELNDSINKLRATGHK